MLSESMEETMIYYKVWNSSDPTGEEYWVSAGSRKEAREAIAGTPLLSALDATDEVKFH
jgi:hypothetical protein